MNKNDSAIELLLDCVRIRFYAGKACPGFHRDRRMLLYALSWPAQWFDQRGLKISDQRYTSLVSKRIDDIARHGNPTVYQPYFPRYLLKVLQDYFAWHGDELYFELKHIRNHLHSIEQLLNRSQSDRPRQEDCIPTLARIHRILKPKTHTKNRQPNQLELL